MRVSPFRLTAVLWLLAGLPSVVAAQPARTFDELVRLRLVEPGARITVRDASGRDTTGRLGDVRGAELVLLVGRDRVPRAFGEPDVQKIFRARGRQPVWGAILGAAAGIAVTAAAASAYGENEGGDFCASCMVQWSTIAVPVGAGLGAAIGFALRGGEKTLYVAPGSRASLRVMPILSEGRAGVRLTARF